MSILSFPGGRTFSEQAVQREFLNITQDLPTGARFAEEHEIKLNAVIGYRSKDYLAKAS